MTMRKEGTISFQTPMIRAILREIEQPGTGKTQTRRVAKFVTENRGGLFYIHNAHGGVIGASDADVVAYGPNYAPYQVGDRLWVREAWRVSKTADAKKPRDITPRLMTTLYEAGGSMGGITKPPENSIRPASEYVPDLRYPESMPDWVGRYRPPMFMPRWASRLTLIVTDVRVQRLQGISEEDARAEGVERDTDGWRDYLMPATQCCASAKECFRTLWNSINGEKHPWNSNPWIVAVTFRPVLGNIDNIKDAA